MNQSNIIKKDLAKLKFKPNLFDYDKEYSRFNWLDAEKEIDFFKDKKLNIAFNCIDRHAFSLKKNKIALLFESLTGVKEKYSYLDFYRLTNKFANVLDNLNVKKGDRVFIFLPTIPERFVAFLGILKLGAIAGTMFSAFQEMALLDRLLDSGAKILITSSALFPRIEKIWKDLPSLEKVIIVERDSIDQPKGNNIYYYNHEMELASDEFEAVHLNPEEASYMLYTSGTTGKPKGVVHAHRDIVSAVATTKYVLDVKENDIYWCTADLGWVTGVVYGVLGIFGLGGTVVAFEGKFSSQNWYRVLQDYQVSIWYTAPTAIRMLMGSEILPRDYNLKALRFLGSVGEPLNPEAIWWGLEEFGLAFHDTWWQTEQGAISITNFEAIDIKPGSMGKPFLGVKAAIIDDQGKELGINKEGNLALKKDTVYSLMTEIWKNEEKYKSYFKNDWYISGDRAYKDEDGYFWFVGRADDVIKTSGERIGPFEVESALVENENVVEAGVIGVPDDVRGEIIMAFVVLKPGVLESDQLAEDLQKFVKQKLAGHAYPRKIKFIEKLPKTRSGKIMRRLLKAQELGLPLGDTSTLEDY